MALKIAEEAKSLITSEFGQKLGEVAYVQKLRQVYTNEISPIVKRAEQDCRNAKYIAEEYEGFTEENFRDEAKRRVMTRAAEELAKVYEQHLLPPLELLRDPASYYVSGGEGRGHFSDEGPTTGFAPA